MRLRLVGLLLGFMVTAAGAQDTMRQTRSLALEPAIGCTAVDGDTIDCQGEAIRIKDIDTPETWTVEQCATPQETRRVLFLGYAAQGRLQQLMRRREVFKQREPVLDRYRRTIATVYVGREKVADILIKEGLGRAFLCPNGRCPRRQPWCD